MRIVELVIDVRIRQLERGLRHLAGKGCSSYAGPGPSYRGLAAHGECAKQGREPFAEYAADKWCDACFAQATLNGTLPNEPVEMEARRTIPVRNVEGGR